IEPNVGPILGRPNVSVTHIPVATSPGNISVVFSTTASSPPFTHIGSIPFQSTRPLCINLLTATESCPEASTTILLSSAIGSTQVIFVGSAETGIQFTTTPPTRLSLRTKSSNFVSCRKRTPASHAAAMSLEHASGPQVAYKLSLIFL